MKFLEILKINFIQILTKLSNGKLKNWETKD